MSNLATRVYVRKEIKNLQFNNRGQAVIEYVLLLVVLVSIALVIVGGLVGRTGEPGVVIKAWSGLLTTIAQDYPDRRN